jgi:hypothetical protein
MIIAAQSLKLLFKVGDFEVRFVPLSAFDVTSLLPNGKLVAQSLDFGLEMSLQ